MLQRVHAVTPSTVRAELAQVPAGAWLQPGSYVVVAGAGSAERQVAQVLADPAGGAVVDLALDGELTIGKGNYRLQVAGEEALFDGDNFRPTPCRLVVQGVRPVGKLVVVWNKTVRQGDPADPRDALHVSNYRLEGSGQKVLRAERAGERVTVLYTGPLVPGQSGRLHVERVEDLVGNAVE